MRRFLPIALAVLPLCFGCQAGVMMARIVMGDPKITSPFEATTHVDLEDQDQPVYVVCTVPSVTTEEYESLAVDLPDELVRRLRRKGVPTGDASNAINKAADIGGQVDPVEVARQLDEGYLVYIDLDRYSLSEDGGNTLYRGKAAGGVFVYRIGTDGEDAEKSSTADRVTEVFHRGFDVTYPGSHPVPVDQLPASVFAKRFEDHLAGEIGRLLYSYRMTESI